MIIDDKDRPARQPVFQSGFPLVVLALTALITATSLIQFNAGPALEDWMMRAGAIVAGTEFDGLERPYGAIFPLVGHTLLHVNLLHLVMNMSAMVSFGPIIALGLGRSGRAALVFLAFFAVCAIGGALAELWWAGLQGETQIAIGASSALSGFLPAVGFLRGGLRGAWAMSVPWIIINVILAVTGGVVDFPIAWAAHLGGLAAGFLFPAFLALARR